MVANKWAYYNDSNPQKCAWVRELIKRRLVTDGEVDERPIQVIQPDDLNGFRRCHFFCGIAIWDYALNLAGWPDDQEVTTFSCPCQSFSAAGSRKGFADERHLWPEMRRLIESRRPQILFGEQVSSVDGLMWWDLVKKELAELNYSTFATDIPACALGAPHRRQRLYFVGEIGIPERVHSAARVVLIGQPERVAVGRNDAEMPERNNEAIDIDAVRDMVDRTGYAIGELDTGTEGSTGDRRQHIGVADAESAGLPERERSIPTVGGFTGSKQDGDACGLENSLRSERRPDHQQQDGHGEAPGRDEGADRTGERSAVERLEDPDSERLDRKRVCVLSGEPQQSDPKATGRGASWFVAHSNGADTSAERLQRSGQLGQQPQDGGNVPMARGPVNGFWKDADWVLTRPQRVGDRPGLRPVIGSALAFFDGVTEGMGSGGNSGFPLAQKEEARIMRLRGYGDGIVAPVAEAFIRAYVEVRLADSSHE